MQLRIARLCLDCEELYAGDHCPVCASERYAFLSRWLPSEERRRWRRPARRSTPAGRRYLTVVKRLLGWSSDLDPVDTHGAPKTRASDFVPNLDFEEPAKEPQKAAARTREPLKSDAR